MIHREDPNSNKLQFCVDEDSNDPEYIVTIEMKNDLIELLDNEDFLHCIDRKLSHIYTISDLWQDGNFDSINRIERKQQEVYDQTWIEINPMGRELPN